LAYCEQPDGPRPALIDDHDVRATLAEIYTRLEVNRILSMRNYWLGTPSCVR